MNQDNIQQIQMRIKSMKNGIISLKKKIKSSIKKLLRCLVKRRYWNGKKKFLKKKKTTNLFLKKN